LGGFRNTGFVFAENINIANTVENLINERRLANPGTVEFEAGGGNWVFERGQRAQPGGFMSAVNWNIDAQHIQSIGGTFEFKGMTDAQTAQFTSFLRAQLQSMYGESFSESDIRDAISQDFHANKKPNQLRMILAVVVAIIIVVVTQGTGAQLAGSLLGTAFTGATATAISAAYTALLVGMSTQLITTGRIDFRALFQNIVIAAITAGLVQGLTNFAGSENFLSPSTATGIPASGFVNGNFVAAGGLSNGIIQAGIRATVAGGISAATGQGNFGQAFTGSVVSSLAAAGANWIGDQFPRVDQFDAQGVLTQAANPIGNILAHAVLGCASAAAQRQECASGALGGAVGELVAPAIASIAQNTFNLTPNTAAFNATVQSVSSLTAGLVTTALGRNGVTATNAASNAIENNYLNHQEVSELLNSQLACKAGDTAACNRVTELQSLDVTRNQNLRSTCNADGAGAACARLVNDAYIARASFTRENQNQIDRLVRDNVGVFAAAGMSNYANWGPGSGGAALINQFVNGVPHATPVAAQLAEAMRVDALIRFKGDINAWINDKLETGDLNGAQIAGLALLHAGGEVFVPTTGPEVVLTVLGPMGAVRRIAALRAGGASEAVILAESNRLAMEIRVTHEAEIVGLPGSRLSNTPATRELLTMEMERNNAHFLSRHGDQVTLEQLERRAQTGLTPEGVTGRPIDSTRWLSNDDMLAAIRQAETSWASGARPAGNSFVWDAMRTVGDGYMRGTSTYARATFIEIRIDSVTGRAYTAYPRFAPPKG
jgi:Possible hemagglutinin (DUF637)/Pre-toxin domain with VENN motif